ncbi:MAG TPA: GH25 family lysozyme, partial [Ruminococcus flavefaciens]|nr:GH25 family lysozyme [Ruminococcus flavefaciens]
MKGIDVSVHNGNIDWGKVKADGIDFAILRAGYGRLVSQKDERFEQNYAGAKAVGLPIGAYWYSYAMTPEEAELEADVFLSVIKGKRFEMPVYFDLEEKKQFDLGKEQVS